MQCSFINIILSNCPEQSYEIKTNPCRGLEGDGETPIMSLCRIAVGVSKEIPITLNRTYLLLANIKLFSRNCHDQWIVKRRSKCFFRYKIPLNLNYYKISISNLQNYCQHSGLHLYHLHWKELVHRR